jgi:hypothetical protein
MSSVTALIEDRNRNIAAGVLSPFAAAFLLVALFTDDFHGLIKPVGPFVIVASVINVFICWRGAAKFDSSLVARAPSVEDRLDELERRKRRDMVTLEEYAAKRQDTLEDP